MEDVIITNNNTNAWNIIFVCSGSPGRPGMDGIKGRFNISIIDTTTGINNMYDWRYDLLVKAVKYYPQKNDGIIEPGCLVNLFPTYENTGGCPTPKYQVFIPSSSSSSSSSLLCPSSLILSPSPFPFPLSPIVTFPPSLLSILSLSR